MNVKDMDLDYIKNKITGEIEDLLTRAGVYYRIHSRAKHVLSIEKKMREKVEQYAAKGEKMQDIIGLRIVLYFRDDVNIVAELLRHQVGYIPSSESNSMVDLAKFSQLTDELKEKLKVDDLSDKVFMPERLNLVFKMGDQDSNYLQEQINQLPNKEYIDNTYEIQIRSVLSEGWHELEHDLRYKTKKEGWWKDCAEESRWLNGIYATLETSDRDLEQVFREIARKNYKKKCWSAMIKNHCRLRVEDSQLLPEIENIFNTNSEIAKKFLRCNRNLLIETLFNSPILYVRNLNNLVFLINRIEENPTESIVKLETEALKDILDRITQTKNQ